VSAHARVSVDDVRDRTVAEAMLPTPKTLPPDATVADVRRLFERETMWMVLLADGAAFHGAIGRGDIPDSVAGDRAAREFVGPHGTIAPDAPVAEALDRLARAGGKRLVVVDGSTLRGLLCLSGGGRTFCVGP
jgi:CBS domain-containing protein